MGASKRKQGMDRDGPLQGAGRTKVDGDPSLESPDARPSGNRTGPTRRLRGDGVAPLVPRAGKREPVEPSCEKSTPVPGSVFLRILNGAGAGEVIPLHESGVCVLGRSSSADVQIPDSSASRRHCRLIWMDDGLLVQDVGSANQLVLNGDPVDSEWLRLGDLLTIGETDLLVTSNPTVAADEPELGASRDAAPRAGTDTRARARAALRSLRDAMWQLSACIVEVEASLEALSEPEQVALGDDVATLGREIAQLKASSERVLASQDGEIARLRDEIAGRDATIARLESELDSARNADPRAA